MLVGSRVVLNFVQEDLITAFLTMCSYVLSNIGSLTHRGNILKLSRLPRSRLLVRARFSAAAFAAMMSGYVQSPLGNSEHGENRGNESHTGHAEGRVE
jgi:hypothetical protein